MADDSAKTPLTTEEAPPKPQDSSVQRLKSDSEEEGGKTRHGSGGSSGSPKAGQKPKLYKQISTESRGKHGSGGKLPKTGSGGGLAKTGSDASFGPTQQRQRTFSTGSRVSYVSYSARRPSLSLSHSDAIPYYLEKPSKEEIDPDKAVSVFSISAFLRQMSPRKSDSARKKILPPDNTGGNRNCHSLWEYYADRKK